ncbi:MAG: dienelactone hydrolase family protein [Planctomycetaceae bacterium]|nr:dienelactone hydrolase family protein [Planctomycetaceae bacterium]
MRHLTLLATAFWIAALGCQPPGPVAIPAAGKLPQLTVGTHKESVEVPGAGRVKYTIDIPADAGSEKVPLVLALHYGYDGSVPEAHTGADLIDAFRPGLGELKAIVIAPDVLGGDWTDAQNEQAAVWLTQSAMQTYDIDPKRVIITGFSMGGAGTWYIGSRHQDVFTAAIPVAAPVTGSTDWKIPVYSIHSQQDDIVSYSAAKKHADAIKAKGGKIEFKSVTGLTHYDTGNYASHLGEGVKWLQEQWK